MLSAIVEMPHGEEDRIEVREELKQWGFWAGNCERS